MTKTPKTQGLVLSLITVCTLSIGCQEANQPTAPAGEKPQVLQEKAAQPAETPVTDETVLITDPVEKSFTVEMPQGWRNQAYLKRVADQVRVVVTSLSLDSNTVLYSGDPSIPSYIEPSSGITNEVVKFHPLVKLQARVPASEYFPNYVKKKFGKLPDFKITSSGPSAEVERVVAENLARGEVQANVDALQVAFRYTEKGKLMRGLINGAIVWNGTIWLPNVSGISTTGDPQKYEPMLLAMMDSHRTSPEWKRKEQENHEKKMAILRQNYANDLALYRSWNRAHEMRMQAIQAAGEASMKSWYERQAQSDDNHRRFLNYINDENTVVSSSGKAFQVDNSFERYYRNKNNNTYIGTKSTTDIDDLRRVAGVNPDDYEEVKIKR